MTGHPLDRYEDKISELASHHTGSLEGLAKGVEVALCGVLTGITRKRNKEGKPWAAMNIEDRNGSVEAMVFANNYERLAAADRGRPGRAGPRVWCCRKKAPPPKLSVQDVVAAR